VALCGASPVFRQVTVSPIATVTDAGLKKRSPIVTLAEADLCAFGEDVADASAAEAAAGTPPEAADSISEGSSDVRRVEPADASAGGASAGVDAGAGLDGSAGVVVVVASVVVSGSCAAEIAGTAQTAARTSVPLARALAPFIACILWAATSRRDTDLSA
jgi:hypothetical protein